MTVAWSGPARAIEPKVLVEVGMDTADVQGKLVRRLVQLELTDVTVPPPVEADAEVPLYFRVIPLEGSVVRVELWQVGVSHGARNVSSNGGAHLTARRIALACAELARRLRHRRKDEIARAERAARDRAASADQSRGYRLEARTTLSAAVTGAAVGPGDFWLIGPTLRGGLRFSSGARLDIGVAWLAGAAGPSGVDAVRWLELSLSPGYAIPIGDRFDLDVGVEAAAAAVHVNGVLSLDDGAALSDTWSGRATGHVRLELQAGDLRFAVGPEVGAALRPIQGVAAGGEPINLGGLWVGGSVAIVFDPVGRRLPRSD